MQAARSIVNQMTGEESELDFCFEMFAHVTKFFGHKVVLVGLYKGRIWMQGGLAHRGNRLAGDFWESDFEPTRSDCLWGG